MNSTVVTVVGLIITAFLALVAARPVWFRNWRIRHRDGDGRVLGSSRLGDSSPSVVTGVYVVLAILALIGTFVVRDWVISDQTCDQAKAIYESASDRSGWSQAAEAAGYSLEHTAKTSQSGNTSYATYQLLDGESEVATWIDSASLGNRFSCTR